MTRRTQPAVTLGQWHTKHAGHRTRFDAKIGEYRIYCCSTCGAKFYVADVDHSKGDEAAGQEKE